MNQELLGVDLGGTTFNIGRVVKGMVVDETSVLVDSTKNTSAIFDTLVQAIDKAFTSEVKGIGIGVPGIVDTEKGIIYDIQNIPAWKEVPLERLLRERFGVKVVINNDANCFALGEKRFGKGKEYHNFVGLSIGTGLGMGVIINDRLYNGVMCGAGEIGMLPYKDGIVEEYAGSFFFDRFHKSSALIMHERANQNDPKALEAFEQFGIHLGEAIKKILFMFAPEAIILGGSISKAFRYFEKSMNDTIATFAYPKQIENLYISCSTHPNLPILGAASLCTI